jgi:hypothetical protein
LINGGNTLEAASTVEDPTFISRRHRNRHRATAANTRPVNGTFGRMTTTSISVPNPRPLPKAALDAGFVSLFVHAEVRSPTNIPAAVATKCYFTKRLRTPYREAELAADGTSYTSRIGLRCDAGGPTDRTQILTSRRSARKLPNFERLAWHRRGDGEQLRGVR